MELLGNQGLNIPHTQLSIGTKDDGWPLGAALTLVSQEMPHMLVPSPAAGHHAHAKLRVLLGVGFVALVALGWWYVQVVLSQPLLPVTRTTVRAASTAGLSLLSRVNS